VNPVANKVYLAIVQLNNWKHHLKDAIEAGVTQAQYDPDSTHTEFGRWLKDNAELFAGSPHYAEVNTLYQRFYGLGEQILAMSLLGKRQLAQEAIAYGSEFDHVSQALIKAIIAWHDQLTK